MKKTTNMKKLSFLLLFIILFMVNASAQNIPRGMKYQAVARDLKGEVLSNAKIALRINLLSKADATQSSHYSEIHSVVTNQLGLFTLVVGEGKMETGDFEKVPWSSADIWMEIQIKTNGQSDFTSISNSQLLAVPYAYYAATAGELVSDILQGNTAAKGARNTACPCEGGLAQIEVLYQGGPTTPVTVKVFRNKNLTELLRTKIGVMNGDTLKINATMYPDGKLKNETYFQVLTPALVSISVVEIGTECEDINAPWDMSLGETFGNFSVLAHNDKRTNARCTVCDVQKDWHVGGNGLMDLCNKLGTKSNTDLVLITNNLERLKINKNGDINVGSKFIINGSATPNTPVLKVADNSTGYISSFVNTNGGDGDGIKIQLGRGTPLDLNGFSLPTFSTFMPGISGAISNSFFQDGAFNTGLTATSFVNNISNGVSSDVMGYVDMVSSGLCKLTNIISEQINDYVLPIHIPGQSINLPSPFPTVHVSGVTVGGKIPIANCPPFTNPFDWDLNFPTVSSDPLTSKNEFVGFFDKNGDEVGAIRGQSLQDYIGQFTDIPHFISAINTFVSAFDLDFGTPDPFTTVKMGLAALEYFVNTWDEIGSIGVEYSSGSGDYAEWLERKDPDEVIGTGDIVAVKGGKITKDLTGAEQIMAVSHHPIVLGNIPEKEKTQLGNNIAFMGQIPVKVMGPVKAGDYIVAKSNVQGYGVAVDPINMQLEDYKLAVGRSWATNAQKGPKMVNTVVGVHNNNFLDLIKGLKEKNEENDLRLKAIEAKLNMKPVSSKVAVKKGF